MIKVCVICGAEFKAPPSSKKSTCSPACRSVRCSQAQKGKKRPKSEATRNAMKNSPAVQARMRSFQKIGTAAAMKLPEGQRGAQNRTSKVWELIDPMGNRIIVEGLSDWARKNYKLFEPPDADPEAAALRIRGGFAAIAGSMRGIRSRKRQACTYKGWKLASLPKEKNSCTAQQGKVEGNDNAD